MSKPQSLKDKYNKFYNENINKCYTKNTYPISHSRLQEWVEGKDVVPEKILNNNIKYSEALYNKNISIP